MQDSFETVFGNKHKVMFVFAHPDDAEIYAGGTIARLVASGKQVFLVKMTLGNRGSRQQKVSMQELAETRRKEDYAAAKVMGVPEQDVVFLEINDGEVEDKLENIEKVAKLIRKYKPDIIATHNPEHVVITFAPGENWINHRDHMNTGKIVTYAAYPYSRDLSFFPEHFEESGLESHSVTEFLYVDYYDHPQTVGIEVTDYVGKKESAIAAHSSQYSEEKAKDTVEFFTAGIVEGKNFERFRYVEAD